MSPLRPDVSYNLALAMIASSHTPLLLIKGDLTMVAASGSFCTQFDIDPQRISGRLFSVLGSGEWNIPQLTGLLNATAAGYAEIEGYETELHLKNGTKRRLIINAQKLQYGDEDNVLLLVAVSDVTEARLVEKRKDDKLSETATLLQELQHRVANSLQIVASVLMQSARKVQSDETRGHLRDAHNRLMSVATLQQQLAMSSVSDVKLRPYFTALCDSIAASMIRNRKELALTVTVDDSSINADASVSLGLIITELVINALKHAFPDERSGKIQVAYRRDGSDWTLSVTDNGIGMPAEGEAAKPGLGTSIVRALARQLECNIEIADAGPGTIVSIVHTESTSGGKTPDALLEAAV